MKVKYRISIIGILLSLTLASYTVEASDSIHHDLKVALQPEEHRLTVQDRITVPEKFGTEVQFLLHRGLNPSSPTPGVRIDHDTRSGGPVPLEVFWVTLPAGQNTFTLEYAGKIYHPLESYGREYARGFRITPGIISREGVYLKESSYWYPHFDAALITFTLRVNLPGKWDAVSQGKRTLHERKEGTTTARWESPEFQDEIFLIAGEFTEYTRSARRIEAMVFLRSPDESLANKYLDATASYLAMYEKLIGPYPYTKFAAVENFWETGFGMPSFTLLGPKVIRFPFILHSSYPHEILHNWWGNSVYPDYEKGNWSEGLTAYLSDHLIKEQRGDGVEYRQTTLQKYADYVLSGRDFPLTQFRARRGSPSEAVGYGKSLMFFHMLRQHLGDKIFVKGLQGFYRGNKFRTASFDDLRKSFEEVSSKDLKEEFQQWVTRKGAPQIKVTKAAARKEGDGFVLTVLIEQIQPDSAYHVRIPVAITLENHDRAYQTVADMKKKKLELTLFLNARPLRLDVDPEFDLFRKLDREEIPPALSQAFGAKNMLILLPSSAEKNLLTGYGELAEALKRAGPDIVEVRLDKEIRKLPSDRAVTIIGWENRFVDDMVSASKGYDVDIHSKSVRTGRTKIQKENHTVVLTTRNPKNRDVSLTWIAADVRNALPGLGRKLPHYHKYSYLAFEGDEPANVAKGRWSVLNSPMTVFLPLDNGAISRVKMGKLPDRNPLASLPPVFSEEKMMDTVRFLSNKELLGRGFGTKSLDRVAQYIAQKFQESGLIPFGDEEGSFFQTWEDTGGEPERTAVMKNIVGIIPGTNPALSNESVVVGAHYDHLGLGWPDVRERKYRGQIHPGADDNASGIAVLIELARVLSKSFKPERSVVFVAFTGEEAGKRGSKYYVDNQKHYPMDRCMGMVNIDTVGRLGKKKLLVLGAESAAEWVHIYRGAGYVTGVDIETVTEELDSSDQRSFHEAGVPAVQLFTGPHPDYHRPGDTVDKIDPEGLVKVASVAKEAVEYLASRHEPLTSTLKPTAKVLSIPRKKRKISLGTIPDFSYSGEGSRISGVMIGSPAEESGLKEGDVIIGIKNRPIHNLRDFSNILKSLQPGDKISIDFLRNGKKMKVDAEVVEK